MHPIFPTDSEGNIKMKPIGYIKLPMNRPQTGGLKEAEAEIIISDDCARCLEVLSDSLISRIVLTGSCP